MSLDTFPAPPSLPDTLPEPRSTPAGFMPTSEETDEWLGKVDDITEQIRKICDGEITDFEEMDRKLLIQQRSAEIAKEEKLERRQRFLENGRDGKGEGGNYKMFCKRCHAEYMTEVEKCGRCKATRDTPKILMTQKERRAELLVKVEAYKEEKGEHLKRKDRWMRWKKSQALIGKSKIINYHAWQYWEPDTDEEDEPEPIVPKNDPQFIAMEKDIKDRHKKQSERTITANKYKESGNKKLKEGDSVSAIEDYEEGLKFMKHTKPLWTNKALAELKIFRYQNAIDSCSKVLELSEIFDDGFEKDKDINIKAFLRRAEGYRGLQNWEKAILDLKEAVILGSIEAQELLRRTEHALEVEEKAKALKHEAEKKREEEKSKTSRSQPRKVVIEQEEEEAEAVEDLGHEQFKTLMQSLASEEERLLFCTRTDGTSRLDDVLKSTERTCVRWKKARKHDKDRIKCEKEESVQELEAKALKCIKVLRVLMTHSNLVGELCLTAVQHLLNFMHSDELCKDLLCILAENSFHGPTRNHLISAISRNEEHISRLVSLATVDRAENFIPPMPSEEDTEFTFRPPAVHSSIVILGNVARDKKIRSMLLIHLSALIKMITRRLHPNDVVFSDKLCGLLTNLLDVDDAGQEFSLGIMDECLPQIIKVVKEDNNKIPGHEDRLENLLGVIVNALNVSAPVRERFATLKTLGLFLSLAEKKTYNPSVRGRALIVINKALTAKADPTVLEPRFANIALHSLDHFKAPYNSFDDSVVRLVTLLLTNESPMLKRWKKDAKGFEEGQEMVKKLVAIANQVKPKEYQDKNKDSLRASIIGNLALIFSVLAFDEEFDCKGVVSVFVEGLRKETGRTQNNCGVCVTKLAMQERYKPLVRALKGFESLHQIQLKAKLASDEKESLLALSSRTKNRGQIQNGTVGGAKETEVLIAAN